jgi:hypothetical protein
VSVTLERLASVEGRVTVGRTGDPAREFLVETVQVGAAVEGRRPNQKTRSFVDLEGRFSCLLPAGTYEFSTRTASGLRSLPVTVHLPSGQEATHLDLILLQGGRVTGTVWGPDGTRVQEGWIAFYSADPDRSGGKVHSAPIADGRFGIGAFSSGRYLLRACDAAHPEWDLFKEVLVAPGTETRLKLGLGLAGRLSVRVVGDHGEPVPDARVGVRREDGVPIPLFSSKYVREAMERVRQGGTRAQSAFFPSFTRTDDAGSIHPRFLPSGRYVVEIAASGFDSRHEALSIASGRETSVEIRLLRRASR